MKTLPSRLHAVMGLALLAAAASAQAETSPYYFGGALGLARESNIFRTADGVPATSDVIRTATLLVGFDQPIGRQRVRGDVSVRDNNFKDRSDLNNLAYGLTTSLDWSTIERFSGTVSLAANQSLARFNPGDGPTLTKKNVQQNELVSASVRMGLVTRLSAEASWSHYNIDYSASEFDYREITQDTLTTGLRYTFGGALTTGVGLRFTRGKAPRYQEVSDGVFLADSFTGRDIDFTADWIATGASTINARVSIGRQKHEEATNRDFSGLTGRLGWDWRPGGKLRVNTSLTRDDGSDAYLVSLGGVSTGEYDSSRVTTALRVNANYEVTGKISATASAGYAARSLVDTLNQAATGGHDRTASMSLGARWAPLRTVAVNCDLASERRRSSTTLSDPYSVNSVGCSAQVVLQ